MSPWPQLFSRRRKLEQRAAQEAEGASFWTATFDSSIRYKLRWFFDDILGAEIDDAAAAARDLLIRNYGLSRLGSGGSRD
jgi:hypothetical protein